MALEAFTTSTGTYEYVPVTQRGTEKPFTVTVRQLKPLELAKLEDTLTQINRDQSLTLKSGQFSYNILRVGIVNWANLTHEGKDILVTKNAVGDAITDECLERLPPAIVEELADLIVNISRHPQSAHIYLGETPVGG